MMMLVLALNLAAMTALSLAMNRHHRQLFNGEPGASRRRLLRGAALGLMVVALGLCLRARGIEQGLLIWICLLMLGGLLQGLVLAWRPRWCLGLAGSLVLLGGGLALF